VEFRRGLPTTESPAESRKGPCEGVPRPLLASGRGEECARRAWWRRNDAFLLVDGRSRRALRSEYSGQKIEFLAFLVLSSRIVHGLAQGARHPRRLQEDVMGAGDRHPDGQRPSTHRQQPREGGERLRADAQAAGPNRAAAAELAGHEPQ